jgi:hypothetical protein
MSLGDPVLTTLDTLHVALATGADWRQAAAAEVEVRGPKEQRQTARDARSPPSLPPRPENPHPRTHPHTQSIEVRTVAAVAQAEHPIAKR